MVSPEVLEACRRGDARAFEELVESTQRQVFTLALRLVGNRHDAEDVAQEAYLRVFRGLRGFRGDASFDTWMYRIVTNTAFNHLRRRGRFGELLADPDEERPEPAGVRGPEDVAERDEISRALKRLPTGLRTVLVLKEVYDLPVRDIAEEMDLNEGAVKVRLHRARKRLKEELYGQEEPVRHEV